MVTANATLEPKTDQLLAELAAPTSRVALRHGFKGAFIDIELDLWDAEKSNHESHETHE